MGQPVQACACGMARVAIVCAVARATTARQTLRHGKVGMESTSRARPTRLARWEAVTLTKTTARRDVRWRRGAGAAMSLDGDGQQWHPCGPAYR
jgi:hypothetical protein